MKAIKALVIFMGVLLLAGLVLLGYGLTTQLGKTAGQGRQAATGSVFGAVEVPLPAGARVEQVFEAGGRVVLRIVGAGPERFVVLDPAEGAVAGSFVLTPLPPSAPR